MTEQALRDSQKRFERAAQQSREMVWEVNTGGLFTYVSQASTKSWLSPRRNDRYDALL